MGSHCRCLPWNSSTTICRGLIMSFKSTTILQGRREHRPGVAHAPSQIFPCEMLNYINLVKIVATYNS
ncbi:hypothetical protein C1H46_010117 [Malus baccata]|uniref:Uncharacterized protein n=1 Tax=Malus baccata TaxID=106549 RepID=A0A540MZW5_MALBA|nr:hypothetical protein C1H46_010117 [Malus baccata]